MSDAWGDGFATEAATAALTDGFERVGLDEVLAWTSPDYVRSQAVMHRVGLVRDASRDFTIVDDVMGPWNGRVWSARNPADT